MAKGDANSPRPPSSELLGAVRDLVDRAEILNIRPVRIVASLDDEHLTPTSVTQTSFDVALSFSSGPGTFQSKVDVEMQLLSEAAHAVGTIDLSVIVDYEISDEEFEPDEEAAHFFVSTTGYFAAFPYVRELIQSLTARLQLDSMVLGMLRRGDHEPGSIGSVPRPAADTSPGEDEVPMG